MCVFVFVFYIWVLFIINSTIINLQIYYIVSFIFFTIIFAYCNIVGATSSTGQVVVKRLLRSNKFRVRVFVNNLYSNTLNMLGTGVTYCQGELNNMESLEYALTDVDKIVFCESPPQKDELNYQNKFDQFVQDTLTDANDNGDNGDNGDNSDNGDNRNDTSSSSSSSPSSDMNQKELEIQQLSELMEMKAKIAKQVDFIGMQNVLLAYQNVRHADYGTSQAAKRSLFKFQSREEDFGLFSISYDDDGDDYDKIVDEQDDIGGSSDDDVGNVNVDSYDHNAGNNYDYYGDAYEDTYNDEYDYSNDDYNSDAYDDYDKYAMNDTYSSSPISKQAKVDQSKRTPLPSSSPTTTTTTSTTLKTQVNWMKNKFNHGVFVGKLPNLGNSANRGTEASIISSRLRSREDPEKGIDLSSGGFAGFVCRICADGKTYEAYLRTSEYESSGIEYVCKFQAKTKKASQIAKGNKSVNKFATIRLPFSKFTPILRRSQRGMKQHQSDSATQRKVFDGNDVKQIGFRIKSMDNSDMGKTFLPQGRNGSNSWISFYLALSYIKVYRSQPEPEFIYFSDARLGDVNESMINHELKQVIMSSKGNQDSLSSFASTNEATTLFDEEEAKRIITNRKDRSEQELYYKYCGEEILKNSGLSYSIIRIPGLNELASGEFSTLRLKQVC